LNSIFKLKQEYGQSAILPYCKQTSQDVSFLKGKLSWHLPESLWVLLFTGVQWERCSC